MFEANVKIISELKSFIGIVTGDKAVLKIFSVSENGFIRNRKLPFGTLVLLISKLCKKTLSIELEKFFEDLGSAFGCTVSAFSQQRLKLQPDFFYWWNRVLCSSFYSYYGSAVKRWNGYRIVAVDGSNISLVNNAALSKHFGGQSNQNGSFIQAKTLYHYDVLNEIVVLPQISPYRYGELNMAYDAIDRTEEDMLLIYDRYYSNYKMVALHLWQEKERKFVIRANENINLIKAFIKSKEVSSIVTMAPTPASIKGLKKSGFRTDKNTQVTVRLIRVELGRSVEVLMTNLWEEDGYGAPLFKDLYFMRWGIETNIALQKNIVQLESFSGLTVHAVLQDFYATVMMTNLHSVLIKDAQLTIEQSDKKRKYPVKVNKNKSFGKLKLNLVQLFANNNEETILKTLHDHFVKEVIPVRKGRTFKRVRKNLNYKSKHKTYANYKPSY